MPARLARPALLAPEHLDARILPSLPAAEVGQVSRPGAISRTTAQVSPANLTPTRPSTLIEVATRSGPGSALKPSQPAVQGTTGKSLPTLKLSETARTARTIARVSRSGGVTTTVIGRNGSTGAYRNATTIAGDVNGDGRVDQADATIVLAAYPSVAGQKKYNPAADLNHNGQVGQSDLRLLLRNLPAPKNQPLRVVINLVPEDAANYKHMPTTLGGHTFRQDVTVLVRTTPGSLIFQDSGQGNFRFKQAAAIANDKGLARFPVRNEEGLSTYNFLVIDPFGRQQLRSYPVYWLSRAYQAHS